MLRRRALEADKGDMRKRNGGENDYEVKPSNNRKKKKNQPYKTEYFLVIVMYS